jgi:hypothetical protein
MKDILLQHFQSIEVYIKICRPPGLIVLLKSLPHLPSVPSILKRPLKNFPNDRKQIL